MGGWLTKSSREAQTDTSLSKSRLKNVSTSPRITRTPEQLERDKKVRLKKRINEVLSEDYDWDDVDVQEIIEIFTQLLAKDKDRIELAWNNWRLKYYENFFRENLVLWSPGNYKDYVNLTYANLFPCVINQIEGNPIVGFNENSQNWSGMFKLDFLPLGVNDIIAGDGGLLCINGGLQPRTTNPQTPRIPHSEDYNYSLYPQQSILLVCNPLTKEIKFIPRHTNKTLGSKIAWMTTMINPKGNEQTTMNPPKHRYRLYVVGSHEDVPTFSDGNGCRELVLMAYDSRPNLWIFGSIVGQCRFPESEKTSIAIFDEGFMIGGQEKSNVNVEKHKKTNTKSNSTNNVVSKNNSPNFKPRVKPSYVWVNKLFFVHRSSLKWHTLDFEILNNEGFPRENLQAPRLLQCGPGKEIYVVIRSILDPCAIEIHEVLISDGYPTGDYLFETMMPLYIYKLLFSSEKSLKMYDCCAGSQILCFLAFDDSEDDRKDVKKIHRKIEIKGGPKGDLGDDTKVDSKKDKEKTPQEKIKNDTINENDIKKVATLAIYNIKTKRWSTLLTPNLNNEGSGCSYALAKCGWSPNWVVRP